MAYKFSKGTRGLGDITFEDDSDTGIDFEADTIKFETAGNEVLVVSGSNVGIGTSTPDYTLDVAGNIGVNQYIYHNGDSNTYMDFPSNDNITFAAGGSEELKITDGAILVKQYIKHDGDENTHMQFADNKIILKAGNLSFFKADKKDSAPHEVTINDGGNNIDFVVKGNGSNAGNPLLKCDASTGRVGINGVGSPIAELDVAGKIAITEESSTPSQPSDGQGYLYTKSDGKIYWRSHDVSETDLTATGDGGGGGGSSASLEVTAQKTSNYTASNGDFVLVNLVGASGDVTITLPAASSDAQVAVKIAGAANGKIVTVDGNGAETIDGAATRTMDSDYESMHLISDGSNWWRIA